MTNSFAAIENHAKPTPSHLLGDLTSRHDCSRHAIPFDLLKLTAAIENGVDRHARENGFFCDVSFASALPRFFTGHPNNILDMIESLAAQIYSGPSERECDIMVVKGNITPLDMPGKYSLNILISDNVFRPSLDSLAPFFSRYTDTVISDASLSPVGVHRLCRLSAPLTGKLSIQNLYGWGNRYTIEVEVTAISTFAKYQEKMDSFTINRIQQGA